MIKFDTTTMTNNIMLLCKRNGITVNALLKNCGLGGSVIDNLKKGSVPSVDKIYAIAQYFQVSIDYLVTHKE